MVYGVISCFMNSSSTLIFLNSPCLSSALPVLSQIFLHLTWVTFSETWNKDASPNLIVLVRRRPHRRYKNCQNKLSHKECGNSFAKSCFTICFIFCDWAQFCKNRSKTFLLLEAYEHHKEWQFCEKLSPTKWYLLPHLKTNSILKIDIKFVIFDCYINILSVWFPFNMCWTSARNVCEKM